MKNLILPRKQRATWSENEALERYQNLSEKERRKKVSVLSWMT